MLPEDARTLRWSIQLFTDLSVLPRSNLPHLSSMYTALPLIEGARRSAWLEGRRPPKVTALGAHSSHAVILLIVSCLAQ
jgi:hypothetical protein